MAVPAAAPLMSTTRAGLGECGGTAGRVVATAGTPLVLSFDAREGVGVAAVARPAAVGSCGGAGGGGVA